MERGEHGFVTPAVVDVTGCDVPDEEWFGPLVQIHRVDSLDRAIEVANDTRFGLAAGIITDEPAEWDEFLVRSRAGIVNRNRPTTGASSAAPFGGIGHSGNHRPAAFYAADFCAYPVASLVSDRAVRPDQVGPGLPW
jgi:succinylglutamic semialdehyde dehydrogenase